MSKVKIEGNASGTGTLTIAAPNTNTDRTLTLPDSTGEIVTATGGVLPALDGSNLTGISGGGKVLQVVQGTLTGDLGTASTSSTSYIDSGLTASITPTTSGNHILVLVSYRPKVQAPSANDMLFYVNLVEGSTSIHELRVQTDNFGKLGDTVYHGYHIPMNVYRTTSSTSTLTYKVQFACGNSGVGYYKFEDSTITLMEIAA